MKVKDLFEKLKEAVENGHAEDEVVVPVIVDEAVFGPSPTVSIQDMSYGFDWDSKKVFLTPQRPLKKN